MIRRLQEVLSRMLGGSTPTPPAGPRPSAAQRAVEGGIKIEYRGLAERPAEKPATMAWQTEFRRMPRFSGEAWRRRLSKRQRILVVAAAVALVAEAVFLGSRLFVERRLPPETFGIWATEAPAYAGRLFELRARRVAFAAGDSAAAVTVHEIRRVHRTPLDHGVRYVVEYDDGGDAAELRFILSTEPASRIRFVNQPRMVWQRVSTSRTIIPGL